MVSRGVIRSSAFILIAFVIIQILAINFFGVPFSVISFTGRAVEDGAVIMVEILDLSLRVFIHSPENITYNFTKSEPLLLELNITTNFVADDWEYSLYDLRHDVWAGQDIGFTPNSTFNVVRWENQLFVRAHEVDGAWAYANVTFFVNISNSAPILGNISDEIFACEGEYYDFRYNATDIDEERLTSDLSFPNPFFVRSSPLLPYDGNATSFFSLFSGELTKANVGGVGGVSETYPRTITVYDSEGLPDSKLVYITVIEVNNEPVVYNQLGAQTVWMTGDDSVFYHQYNVDDIEDGETADGNLTFNLSFISIGNLFDIGVNDGIMNYTPDADDIGNTYSIRTCVEDNALAVAHQNISVCEAVGSTAEAISVCDDFTLTVTNNNRAPLIINWSPVNLSFSENGMVSIPFYVEVYDADWTIPDIDWYVDNVLIEHNENTSTDTFVYSFACGISGSHTVSIVTSDGLLNSTLIWDVDVILEACSTPPSGGGGGGGSSTPACINEWVCNDWEVCQNVEKSFDRKVVSKEDYNLMTEICYQNINDDERYCGFQVKTCDYINTCNGTVDIPERPAERQYCYYTENPSCTDGITNCHDGACESLKDCGGPCNACPTCSDNKQNQGEENVDCGGPCPYVCPIEIPMRREIVILLTIVSLLLFLVIAYFGYRLFLILREKYYTY